MMLSEVMKSDTLPRVKFAVCSEEGYKYLRRKPIKSNFHLGQLGRQSFGTRASSVQANDTRPVKFPLFCDYKGRLSGRSRVRGYQGGTPDVRLRTHSDSLKFHDLCPPERRTGTSTMATSASANEWIWMPIRHWRGLTDRQIPAIRNPSVTQIKMGAHCRVIEVLIPKIPVLRVKLVRVRVTVRCPYFSK